MKQALLHIDGLSIRFYGASVPAVDKLTLTVNRGEVLAIVGESGSGKSITALSVLRLLPTPPAIYEHGSIHFSIDGESSVDLLQEDIRYLSSIRGSDIAMIFQEPMTSLNPVLTCGEQVEEAIRAHKLVTRLQSKAETLELFERVKLPNPAQVYSKYPHELSGGQKQRVMIAMAISCKPSLLICDEPTTALDVTVQKEILLLLADLQRSENMGMIFISHDLAVVAGIADRIAVMRYGKLVEINDAALLFNHPSHPYTKVLIACRPAEATPGQRLPVVEQTEMTVAPIRQEEQTSASNLQSPAPFNKPILEVEHLNVWYPVRKRGATDDHWMKAVNEVSFTISEGEIVGLVGESGCGKSTLGRAILRLADIKSGKILFEGRDLLSLSAAEMRMARSRMQMIFQDPYSALSPKVRIGEAIAEVLKVHTGLNNQQVKIRVIELLEKVGLTPGHYDRYPHEFSGGQRQRIVIARALALRPSFIVCDESLSALDVSIQAQVLNLLSDLKAEFNFSALFISHDLSVVRYFCNRVIVMQAGKIVETGDPVQIYTNPANPYTRRLLEAIPTLQ
ncbi:MAG TPA: ABC transporter ATP-binding protein [Flavitalea sp.]|nr:ABC transporter ATP-binding protein [Flavitalea sp.]